MKNFFTVKSYSFLALIAILAISLFSNSTAYAQTLASPYVVTTFPSTISNINTAGGETAIGMQGACFTLPCCSVKVFKVTLPANGVLRVEMSNFTPLAGSIIAYRPLVANPTSYSDLQYIAGSPGNFCGFRDTLQLGRAFSDNWDNIPYGGAPTQYSGNTSLYDFNNPAPLAGYYPAGDYYLLVFNENQQTSQGVGQSTDLTFEFAEACAPLTAPTTLNFDTLEYNSESDTVSFFVKNERTLDIDIDTSNISITGTNASEFIFLPVSDTSLAVGDSLQFQVVFTPTSGGARTASVEIPFSDTACSTTSTISLIGYGAQPEIAILGNNTNIANNDLSPSSNNFTDLGPVVSNTGAVTRQFKITNTGSDTLTFTNNPIVSLSGNSQFIISSQPASSVLPGDTTSFEITFTPTVDGAVSADISIANNDLDESTFTFRVEGTGAERNGLDFDGSGDYVNINNVADDMTGITAFSIEAWVKVDPNQVGYDNFLAVNTSSNSNRMFIVMDDGLWEFWVGSTSRTLPGPDIRDDVWHHVAFTFDNGSITYYLDGVQTATNTNNNPSFSASDKWSIGQEWDNGGASDFFNGAINDLRIWKSVKTTQEIADDRYCEIQSPATDPNLIAYYTFNQGISGGTNTGINTITDASSYANDGTPNNFALTGTASNFIAATNVGVNCNSVRISLCDTDSYSVPGGNTYTSSGVYIDTLTNSMGGDSIVYTDLSIRYFQITQDHINDTTVCDTIKEFAQTSYTPFARFENSDNDWVEINGAVDSLVNTNRSVFLWMREADQISGSADILVGINTSGTSTVCNLGIATNEQLWIYDGGNNRYSGVVVTDGQWHFVGYTYDEASNQTQFWVDGVAANSFTNGQSISGTSRISLGQEFDGSSPSNFYDGDMAEVTIWNEVLDAADIALLMESSVQTSHPKYNKLKAYYPMISECNNTDLTLKDFGPHTYNGTMTANDIIITDTLANLTNHNAAPLYSKSWTRNGTQISTSDSLFLTSTIQGGTYGLNLSLDYFNVSDYWITTVNPACQGLFASVVVDAHVSCNGLSGGGATSSATGGTTPYTFSWNTGATTASITGVPAGTYSVTITDNLGSTDSTSITITEPAALNSSASITSAIDCNGTANGQVTASAIGGTTPYTYTWNTGETNALETNLSASTYSVTITDQNGCTDSSSVSISEPAALIASASTTANVSQTGFSDGTASASATGGTTPYNYSWNNGATTITASGLSASTYSVTITDQNGCTDSASTVVSVQPSFSAANPTSTNISCNGLADGTATAVPNGGNTPYTYLWSTGATSASINNLTIGTYTVTITENGGLTATSSISITEPAALISLAMVTSTLSCNGDSDGQVTASATGGTTPYTYTWNTGETNALETNLGASTYSVTITDQNGCTDSSSISLTQPSALAISATSGTDSIDVSVTGGTIPYNYLWSNGATVEDLNNIPSGTYTVTITDGNGCTDTHTENVVNPAEYFVTTWKTDNSGTSNNTSITIPTSHVYTYNYDVDWNGDGIFDEFGLTGDATHDYGTSGTYTVQIRGNFPYLGFYATQPTPQKDNAKILSVEQWGNQQWTSMKGAFKACENIVFNATDVPDLNAATDMSKMFEYCSNFNSDISSWDVSTITNMDGMFANASSFNQNIGSWNVGTVTNMKQMFSGATVFNQNIGTWNVSNVTNMSYMFRDAAAFNQGIGSWNTSSATTMQQMFYGATVFNQDISTWDVDSVTNMNGIFRDASAFNQPIGTWDVGNVTIFSQAFYNADLFNGDISTWDVSSATTLASMFALASNFNQDIGSWDVDSVTNMSYLFHKAVSFDHDLSSWDVGAVTNFQGTFQEISWNPNISTWDVSSATNMRQMFALNDSANIDLSNWDVSSVTNMIQMFKTATSFDQDLSDWDVSAVTHMDYMFFQTGLSIDNYDSTLIGWASQSLQNGVNFHAGNSKYCTGETARQTLTGTYNWSITDSGKSCPPSVSISATDISCNGISDGSATASATNGTSPYNYLWNTGATNATINGLAIGTYSVTITDNNGITDSTSVTITQPTTLVSSTTVDSNATCNGFSDGGSTASATGGTGPYTYTWSNGATNASITGVTADTYSVTITDANGCTDSTSVTITEPMALVASSIVDSNTTCNGLANGGATTSASGGTAPYSYTWSDGSTNTSISGVVAGTYSITITDNNGCTDSTSITIVEPAVLLATTVVDSNISCNGLTDGGTTASATGGTGPYTYAWSNGSTNASITGINAGTYSVTVTDHNGCSSTSATTITEPAILVAASVVDSNVTCNGFANGGATASASGGTMPYTYNWSNGATTASITGIAVGMYTITISDANGCTAISSISITEPNALTATSVADSNATCNGFANGGATATGSGGTAPYNYLWSNSATTASITGIIAGTYTVTLTDANGCTTTSSITITEPNALTIVSVVDSNVTCNGLSDGGATTVASGGTMPYAYIWSNGATTSSINGLTVGMYTVTISDANGCTTTGSTSITEPNALTAASMVDSNVTCNGLSDGGITVSASGGTTPYTYLWNNTDTTASITNLVAGSYTVTITDANGCSSTLSASVTEPTVLVASAVVDSNVTCHGFSNGGATASATGGTGNYTFLWDNSGISNSISGVAAGSYTVTITDDNGCTSTSSITITEPNALIVSTVTDSNTTCFNGVNGGITATPTGGTTPYTYLWSNNANTPSATGLSAGTYTITTSDANGCTAISSGIVTEPTDLVINSVIDSNVSCNGLSNGGITTSATGGTGVYNYLWNNTSNTPSITGLSAGNYTVTISDANSCFKVETVTITEPNILFANIVLDSNATCDGLPNGGASANPSGGTPTYSYNWSVGQTTTSISGLSAGSYTVTITDANACSSVESIIVAANSSSHGFIAVDACSSYTAPSGNYTWTIAGTYTDTIPNTVGCDSIITISLNMLSDSIYQTMNICAGDSFTVGSNTYTSTGVYSDLFTNTMGCDSIVITDLTVNSVDVTVSQNGFQLEANNTFGSYQWINCDSNNAIIPNATNRTYRVTVSGNYSVIVSEGSCTDTSSCVLVDGLGINDLANNMEIKVYPNPTGTDQNTVNIDVDHQSEYDIIIRDLSGKVVYIQREIYWNTNQIDISRFAAGTFFIEIKTDQSSEFRKLIVM